MTDLRILMLNQISFSECETSRTPAESVGEEFILVTVSGKALEIADTLVFGPSPFSAGSLFDRRPANALALLLPENSRIRGRLRTASGTERVFDLLGDLPPGQTDFRPFPVLQTHAHGAILKRRTENDETSPWTLQAWGTDEGPSTCRGWVFDAVEVT
ncbi:hypothetical protein ASG43_12365 [Aureimonas sp. Leaf454]|uniref:hypothetical protein n=1 Tax=Aureimonas sp. Leaf454 TaxID=1736381 RepID=UPI0007005A75|nr:hypothetical protein [Aureimonas sp. Leaf454]KQT45093.1 hypothetical protein ASG43_12365 [Aureimonas sp. Leaf454]